MDVRKHCNDCGTDGPDVFQAETQIELDFLKAILVICYACDSKNIEMIQVTE